MFSETFQEVFQYATLINVVVFIFWMVACINQPRTTGQWWQLIPNVFIYLLVGVFLQYLLSALATFKLEAAKKMEQSLIKNPASPTSETPTRSDGKRSDSP